MSLSEFELQGIEEGEYLLMYKCVVFIIAFKAFIDIKAYRFMVKIFISFTMYMKFGREGNVRCTQRTVESFFSFF